MPSIDPKTTMAEIRKMYELKEPHGRFLILSRKGVGKTRLLQTCRRPVLLDLFDTGGEITLLDGNGQVPPWLFIRDYSGCTKEDFSKWRSAFENTWRSDLLNSFGTYALDSITNWNDAHMNHTIPTTFEKGHDLRQDWGVLLKDACYYMKRINQFPCDVCCFGHIKREQEEVTGHVMYKVLMSGSGDVRIPTIFSESFSLICEDVKSKEDQKSPFYCMDNRLRYFITRPTGFHDCSTRAGRLVEGETTPRLDDKEPADIKRLLKKVGLPYEDLPYA